MRGDGTSRGGEAENVGTKKKLMKEVLREMRKRERVNVEPESEQETNQHD